MAIEKLGNVGAINPTDLFQSQGLNTSKKRGPICFGRTQFAEKEKYNSDGTISRQYLSPNGVLFQETKYNVDKKGKETIASVTRYDEKIDSNNNVIKTVTTFVDEDGDGYNDYVLTKTYTNGRLTSENKKIEENINDVKNRGHLAWELQNREMFAHDSCMYAK